LVVEFVDVNSYYLLHLSNNLEVPTMPRLNLKDEGLGAEGAPETGKSPSPAPMLREVGAGGGRVSPIILIILIVVVLAGGVFALNHFKVIRLWGKKAPVVTETLPEPEPPAASNPASSEPGTQTGAAVGNESTSAVGTTGATKNASTTQSKKELSSLKAAATSAPSGSGKYTVQFAAWMSKSKADQQASLLAAAGYEAFVDETHAGGDHWYRVRVGRYDSRSQAQDVVGKLQPMTEDVVWVATLRSK
jgi:cell division septation protein DedD